MAIIKNIVQAGNPILRRKSVAVNKITSSATKKIIKDLVDTMRASNLIGISAPQIGKNYQIFATELRKTINRNIKNKDNLRIFVNPKLIKLSKEKNIQYEGCGSVGYSQFFGPVRRSKEIIVQAFNEKNEKFIFKADGLIARAIQHEIDHLNGILFTDKVCDYKKIMSSEEYKKLLIK